MTRRSSAEGAGAAVRGVRGPRVLSLGVAAWALAGAGHAALDTAGRADGPGTPPAEVEFEFDTEILRNRGLNPGIAAHFRTARGFDAGAQPVQLTVNGQALGRRPALFDGLGRLCFTPEFVRAAGLLPMDGTQGPGASAREASPPDPAHAGPAGCPDYRGFAGRTVVLLQAPLGAVDITVPADFVQRVPRAGRTDAGGVGAMFNYRGFATESRQAGSAGPAFRYRYLDTTAGFNAGDWLFRSRQDYAGSQAQSQFRWRSAYAQKTFESYRQVLQAGRLSLQSPLYGGLTFDGAQWLPERALYSQQGSFAVTGVARSRARVELRQNGVLLLNTTVPPGPFSLTDYAPQSRTADLQVRVVEDNGAEQSFTVPAASLLLASANTQFEGWNLAAGRSWDPTGRGLLRQVPVVAASRGWVVGRYSGVAGGQFAPGYGSVGAALNARFAQEQAGVFGQLLASHDSRRGSQGALASASASGRLGEQLQAGVSANLRSAGYRSLQEALALQQPELLRPFGYRSQVGGNLAWMPGAIGAFAVSLIRENYFFGDPGHVATLHWNKSWNGGVSLSVGLSHRTARRQPVDAPGPQAGDGWLAGSNYLYASISMPLGAGVSSRSDLQRTDGATRLSTSIEQRVNEFFGYRATVDRTQGPDDPGRGTSLSAFGTPYFASVSGGVSRVRDADTVYAEASGGVVATGDGIAFSPYAVQDSFGTLRTGDVAKARIDTPQGASWSGWNGLAALPNLPAYQESRIELGGHSIPLDVEVDDGLQVVRAGRGAVVRLNMPMRRVQRLMLTVVREDGTPLPVGTAVLRGANEYFTAAAAGGRVLVTLRDDEPQALTAELADGRRCAIVAEAAEPAAPGQLFAQARARCA